MATFRLTQTEMYTSKALFSICDRRE